MNGSKGAAPAAPVWLTVEQYAELMGISKWTGWRLARAGKLPEAIHIGRSWRVPAPSTEAR